MLIPSDAWPNAMGLLGGVVLDRMLTDPQRGHPVAAFGGSAAFLEQRVYAPTRFRGVIHTALGAFPVAALGIAAARFTAGRPLPRGVTTAAVTWSVLGGAMLGREALGIAEALDAGDLEEARRLLPRLCGRDPSQLDESEIARAAVESVAENTSDAVVAPLLWGGLLGMPGLLTYRAVNTLDAMVGHHSERYERFGWAAARLDDVANWLPSRLTGLLASVLAFTVQGSAQEAVRTQRVYGVRHPSPNAGQCEAVFAGALGVRMGGRNAYSSRVEYRPELGAGRRADRRDIRRAVRLARGVNAGAAVVAAAAALASGWVLGCGIEAASRRSSTQRL